MCVHVETVCLSVCRVFLNEKKTHRLAAGLCKEEEGEEEGMDREENDDELEEEQRKLGQGDDDKKDQGLVSNESGLC